MSDLFNKLNKLKDGISGNMPKNIDPKAGLLGAAGIGGLLGAVLGGSGGVKRAAKNVAVVGGSAALGALAFKLFQKWQGSNNQQPPQGQLPPQGYGAPQQGGFGYGAGAGAGAAGGYGAGAASDDPFAAYNNQQQAQLMLTNDSGKLIIEAMIFAARADGHIDAHEQEMIMSTAKSISNDPNINQTIRKFLSEPLDPNELARKVQNQEQALDVYKLSAAAIVADNVQEQNYLADLARALRIDANTKARLDQEAVQIKMQLSQQG